MERPTARSILCRRLNIFFPRRLAVEPRARRLYDPLRKFPDLFDVSFQRLYRYFCQKCSPILVAFTTDAEDILLEIDILDSE